MTKKYYKRNYVEVLEIITPNFYLDDDLALSGIEIDPIAQVINSHIVATDNFSSILDVSSVGEVSLTNISEISPYFIKQNKKTNINAQNFQTNILEPLGKKLGSFESSGDFKDYLDASVIPNIILNEPSLILSVDASTTHEYLVNSLSWMYLLNTSGASWDPSSVISERIAEKLFADEEIKTVDGVKLFTEYLWRNYSGLSSVGPIIPEDFLAGSEAYTSGTLNLDKLLTLVDIIYTESFSDEADTKVLDAFNGYIADGTFLSDESIKGAFYRLLKSVAIAISDVNDAVNDIEAIYNIEKCPKYQLPLIAKLIGWRLFGEDEDSWRLQLRNAVSVYKRKGTIAGIQQSIDGILPDNTFEVSSILTTLYESYVPYLIKFSLITESPYFVDLSTWTQQLATKMGTAYSPNNFDESVNHVVDKILLDCAEQYPENFIFNNSNFDLSDENFVFNYRDKEFKIPPFDDEKFYTDCIITDNLLTLIREKLECFGVPSEFSQQVVDYIIENTIGNSDRINLNNSFLFFTSGLQNPPNFDNIVDSLNINNINALGLWSAKSSHFNLFLEASAYDFSAVTLDSDSGKVVEDLARTINEFSPAHSIPNIGLFFDTSDVYDPSDGTCTYITPATVDQISYTYALSGADMRYGGNDPVTDKRERFEDLTSEIYTASDVVTAPRNAKRRRDYEFLLDKVGLFTRSGFNQPLALATSTLETSYVSSLGILPLGFIPSTLEFAETTDENLSGVYSQCAKLTSNANYFGVDVSNTYPSRGFNEFDSSSCSQYVDRDSTYKYISTVHMLQWQKYLLQASAIVDQNEEVYFFSSVELDNIQSEASKLSNNALDIREDEFELGLPIHRLYKLYTNSMNRHPLGTYYEKYLDGGLDIFSHTYGPKFYNANLDLAGSSTDYISSNLASIVELVENEGSGIFSESGSSAGTYVASTLEDCYVNSYELRNPHIVSAVELVMPSGSNAENKFEYLNLESTNNKLLKGNGLITQISRGGLPRVRFDLSGYVDNKLTPEHDFELTVSSTIIDTDLGLLGGATLGVWIHTKPIDGLFWTYNSNGVWELQEVSELTQSTVISKSHLKTIDLQQQTNKNDVCLGSVDEKSSKKVSQLASEDFFDFVLNFDTKNQPIAVPENYYKLSEQVHTEDQNYYVEVFLLNSSADKLFVLDSISLVDKSNESMASVKAEFTIDLSGLDSSKSLYVSGTKDYDEIIKVSPEQLKDIFSHFNAMIIGDASRDSSLTEAKFDTSGGSRLNYRLHPEWIQQAINSYNQYTSIYTTDQ